jgi:DNA polymerase-1
MSEARKRFVIIDGKSVFYRGFYAMPDLKTKDGTPTGGVYGFAVMALEVIRKLKPDYVCIAWDKPKTNIRKRLELYPEYKAGRKPAPPEFYAQIPILHELLDAFGWPLYELDDYEADDILGTLALQAKAKNIETLLVTSDLDVLQLVDSHTQAYLLKKGLSNIEQYSPESFEAKYGIRADQFLDYKALAGDSSDNIPGVPGIGSKTAIELLKTYKNIEDVYENIDLIKSATAKKLEAGKDLAVLSKKLAQIWTDAPVKLDLNEVDGSKIKPEEIQRILKELEFRSLLAKLPTIFKLDQDTETTNNYQLVVPKNTIIDSNDALDGMDLSKANKLIIYGRSKGSHGRSPNILLISPSEKELYTLVIPKLSIAKIKAKLGPIFKSDEVEKIGYDIKSTIKLAYALELDLLNVGHDVMIGAFLLNPLRREKSLNDLAESDLGYEGVSLDSLDDDEMIARAGDIVAVIRSLYTTQLEELAKLPKLNDLSKNIEWPVIPVLARMEYIGIQLDTEQLKKMSTKLDDQISDLEQSIYGYADQEFNINSPTQLADILFNKLNLPVAGIKKGKSGYSTAFRELDKLRSSHPIVDLISSYRELTKLKNTYVDALPKLVDENSRLHTTYNLTIAQTGRLSSTDPNLQNIPVRTDLGRDIRKAFIAGPHNVLISADYSQFELRLAAYLADDKELIEEFNKDADVHNLIASQIYGRNPEDVTKQMRRMAKAINFGILYGMSPHGLSVATGMTQAASKSFIDKYYEIRRPLIDYMDSLRVKAREQGYAENMFGRRRPMPDINSSNFVVRQAAERAAINMPIQGAEADLMKMAMIAVDKRLKDTDVNVLLQVHDSILVECPESKAKQVEKVIRDTMESVYPLSVKLTVDTIVGKNWGEL